MTHRGPTLGFRIDDEGASLCYLPDHEPALIGAIDKLDAEWLSGYSLARDADVLLHDSQYTDPEYPAHFGWGHSSVSQALLFADRSNARRTLLFHHDPQHTDAELDAAFETALGRWQEIGRDGATIAMAREGLEIDVGAEASAEATNEQAGRRRDR